MPKQTNNCAERVHVVRSTRDSEAPLFARHAGRQRESAIMMRKILSMIRLAAASTQPSAAAAPSITSDSSAIYPYVVPSEYLEFGPENDPLKREIGHRLYVVLVQDHDGLVRNIRTQDLEVLKLSRESANRIADENLSRLIQTQMVKSTVFPKGPQNRPFAVFGGHWAAASSIVWSGLYDALSEALKSSELLLCIPHREALIAFAKGDASYVKEMKALIRKSESDGRKPLSMELFKLTKDGISPFDEDG